MGCQAAWEAQRIGGELGMLQAQPKMRPLTRSSSAGYLFAPRHVEVTLGARSCRIEEACFLFRRALIGAAIESRLNHAAWQPSVVVLTVLRKALCFDVHDEYDGELQPFRLVDSGDAYSVGPAEQLVCRGVVAGLGDVL